MGIDRLEGLDFYTGWPDEDGHAEGDFELWVNSFEKVVVATKPSLDRRESLTRGIGFGLPVTKDELVEGITKDAIKRASNAVLSVNKTKLATNRIMVGPNVMVLDLIYPISVLSRISLASVSEPILDPIVYVCAAL